MAYIGKQPGTGVRNRLLYTATAGQTTFTTSDSSQALSYSDSLYVDVYLNGVLLDPVNDYTATSGTSIVLGAGASAGDILEVIVYDVFSVFNNTIDGNFEVGGDLTVDTNTMFVDSTNNNVGIRTTSQNSFYSKELVIAHANEGGITLFGDSTSGTGYLMWADGTTGNEAYRGYIGYSHSTPDVMVFGTSGSERLRILSGGGLTFNGDTATANALDDYEEGTWTPIFTGSSSNPSVTYDIQAGHYRKIGGLVHASFNLRTDAVASTGSGSLFISGLPFAGTTSSNTHYSGSIGYSASFASSSRLPQTVHIGSNGTIIVLIGNSSSSDANSGLSTAVTTSALVDAANSNYVIGQMTYPTDA